jgi:hypothetical protein
MGRIVIDKDINYSPNPYILLELPCKRMRFTVYLEKMLIKPSGTRAGTPAQKKAVMNSIKYMLAAYL